MNKQRIYEMLVGFPLLIVVLLFAFATGLKNSKGDGVLAEFAKCHVDPAVCEGWYDHCITINNVLQPGAYCKVCIADGTPVKWCRSDPNYDCLSNVNPPQYPQAAVKCATRYPGVCSWNPVSYSWYCAGVPNATSEGDCKLVPCTGSVQRVGGGGDSGS